jgi:acyl-CoA synthetase (AMP-forming)/AMP-acid ligase II
LHYSRAMSCAVHHPFFSESKPPSSSETNDRSRSCFGSILGYMATATHGATLALPSEAFNAAAALDTVRAHNAVALYGVPTMFVAVLEQLAASRSSSTNNREEPGLSRLRTGIAAGSSVPATLMRRLGAEMGLSELVVCYGMTETSPVSCMSARKDSAERRATTVGRPLPHVGIKVVDPADRRRVLDVGQSGELAVCGVGVMSGYWRDEARTAEVLWEEDGVRWMLVSWHVPAVGNANWDRRGTRLASMPRVMSALRAGSKT